MVYTGSARRLMGALVFLPFRSGPGHVLQVDVLHSAGYQQHIGHMAAQAQYLRAVQHPAMVHGPNMAHSTGAPLCRSVV